MGPTADSVRRFLPTRLRRLTAADYAALFLSLLTGVVVFVVATDLFAYHSINDDEGVYLLQAAMLLEGQLFLRPGAALVDLVHPWFFVRETTATGTVMYPKYGPVSAAVFAVGMLLGDAHLALAGVAAGSSLCLYSLGRQVADRTTGLVASALLLSAPLFLLTSSVFLSYAPTTLFTLLFAVAYLRSLRSESLVPAVFAGIAVGVAFFSRPYSALLFALPFILHTLWRLGQAVADETGTRAAFERAVAIALPGLCFVGLTLAYNAAVTGSATTFPYEAFAPRDGLGFGRREILGYTEQYTPALAVASTREALSLFVFRFAPLGVLGSILAAGGVLVAMQSDAVDDERAALVGGVGLSVVLGNLYFWGTLNGLRNGLIDLLGPFYHFDLLVPLSLFGAIAVVGFARWLSTTLTVRFSARHARVALLLFLVCAAPVAATAERAALSDPWAENRQRTESLAATYAPFENRTFENALVYTPDPYGDWQQHPFQYLRNDPGFDGETLYVLDQGPDDDVRALDATNRTPYRFTYRGSWSGAVEPVEPRLTRLSTYSGARVNASSRFGQPSGATAVSVRLETTEGFARYRSELGDGPVTVDWTLTPDGVDVTNLPQAAGEEVVPLPRGASEVDVVVRFVTTGGASVTYRQEVTLDAESDAVRVIWPPETRICRLQPECGTDGTWVGPDGDYLTGVDVETSARVVEET